MLGTASLLTFSFRALVLLILVPMLWTTVAGRYNDALVALAQVSLPEELSLSAIGTHILIEHPRLGSPVSIDGFTLHYGLVLMVVLVLAAVGIGALARVGWLLGMGAGVFALHVVGVGLLARGVAWASASASVESSGTLVFSLFAVFWGLLPAVIGGAWSFMYWLPRASGRAGSASTSGHGLGGVGGVGGGRLPRAERDPYPESEGPDERQAGQDGVDWPEGKAGRGPDSAHRRGGRPSTMAAQPTHLT